jgi:hypothetical protein
MAARSQARGARGRRCHRRALAALRKRASAPQNHAIHHPRQQPLPCELVLSAAALYTPELEERYRVVSTRSRVSGESLKCVKFSTADLRSCAHCY